MYFAASLIYLPGGILAGVLGIGAIVGLVNALKRVRLNAKNNSPKAFIWIGASLLYLAVVAWACAAIWVLFFFHFTF
jgi:hypothetical protein